ncbi:hypothetical protein PROFUN_12993 [Planoprotostelium fungivorum]|uniref:Vesicle transport protein n=1 Tax=Planoprotostelium fungivorum TaxID=1890364 RepID=A0A2P6N617_9EUKA|nr:hypothetical protein PROFUN_12993 [Planoprotostelium fungivorum]
MSEYWKRLTGEPQEEESMMGELSNALSLSWKQRLYGFGICLVIGLLFCLLAFGLVVMGLALIRPAGFAIAYTIGNICALGSTVFLVGPMRQLKMMMKPTRIIATFIYLASLAFTLVAAFKLKIAILVLISIIVQFCALIWYCLSYIPYARMCLKHAFSGVVSV